jgi:hypothetical protein
LAAHDEIARGAVGLVSYAASDGLQAFETAATDAANVAKQSDQPTPSSERPIACRAAARDRRARQNAEEHMNSHPGVPAAVANLDLAVVVEVLARHACNVTDAARDLGVPASDLRRLLWANPKLRDEAFEVVEARLDTAEKNIAEALKSEDSRRKDAASFFVLRNTARAKRRGWITSSVASLDDRERQPATAPGCVSLAQ